MFYYENDIMFEQIAVSWRKLTFVQTIKIEFVLIKRSKVCDETLIFGFKNLRASWTFEYNLR